jgi:hypothetical protein
VASATPSFRSFLSSVAPRPSPLLLVRAAGTPAVSCVCTRSPPLRPLPEWTKQFHEVAAFGGKPITAVPPLDNPGRREVAQPVAQHAGRHIATAVRKVAERGVALAEFPDYAQRPTTSHEVEQSHYRASGGRAAYRATGDRSAVHVTSIASESKACHPSGMPLIPKQSRISPAAAPFDDDTRVALDILGPPIPLFGVFARRPDRAHAIAGWPLLPVSARRAVTMAPRTGDRPHYRALRRKIRLGHSAPEPGTPALPGRSR